jgi:DNA polymerase-3 subunit epsilon
MNNLAVFYDTETTGLPDFKEPSDAPHQPHMVQLAAALVDLDERKIISSIDIIILPLEWEIPDDVVKVHGITKEKAMSLGVSEDLAVKVFVDMAMGPGCTIRKMIGHNESFDARILRIAMKRYGVEEEVLEKFKNRERYCTMRESSKMMNLEPTEKMKAAGFNKAKPPKLSEAYKHFTGKDMVNAHNALADVKACMTVYFELQKLLNGPQNKDDLV